MKTAIDRNESEFDKLKREALEWIENPKSRLVSSFIKIAVETAQQAQPDKGDKPTGQFEEDYPVYDEKYLNECIKKAKPNLSKIKDVDKTLDEIRGNGTDKEIMTKQEIIKLYLGDLKNIVKESPARNNRIAILESELSAIDKQVKEAENTLVEVIKESLSNEILWRVANDWFIGQIQPGKGCFELSREEIISLLVDFTRVIIRSGKIKTI